VGTALSDITAIGYSTYRDAASPANDQLVSSTESVNRRTAD
jgi:hypothetical protein